MNWLWLKPGRAAALLTLALGTLGSVAAWQRAREESRQEAEAAFVLKAREAEFAMARRMRAYENALRGGVGLFAAMHHVDRKAWHAYVNTLALKAIYPGIQGMGFARTFPPQEREALERQVRADGFPSFRVWPPGARPLSSAIIYLEPFDWRNQRAFGYDMLTEPTRNEAMSRARDQGQAAISGRVRLVQETKQAVQHGFLMYLPVYSGGEVPATPLARRQLLQGYVYSPFRMNDLMQGILGRVALPNIRLEVFDGPVAAKRPMYDSAPADPGVTPLLQMERQFLYGGRNWTLRFSSLPTFEATIDRQTPLLLLGGGLVISALMAVAAMALMINRARAHELARSNAGLQDEVAVRTRLLQVLEQSKEAAEAANRAKSAFLAAMSHELRTPLNAVLGYAQILQRDRTLTPRQQQGLSTIQSSGQHLLTLINDILDLSRIEAGKLDILPCPLRLHGFLAVIADIVRVKAEKKSLLFRMDIPPDIPDGVLADEKRLRQILLNLLSNAVKFTERGQVELAVVELARQNGSVTLRFEVRDTGIGIAPEAQQRIFQPFEQVGDLTRRASGTGLGLPISRQLVRLMGGNIQLESAPGRGSRFSFELTLPVADVPAGSRNEHSIVGYEGVRRSVLVVDDVVANRGLLLELLGGLGFRLDEAENGEVALTLARQAPPDLIIMDMVMPVLDGLQTTRLLRQTPTLCDIPVLIVSASATQDDEAAALAAGANAFIAKPIDEEELLQEVAALLRLEWSYKAPERMEIGEDGVEAELVPPPPDEMPELYQLAREGHMSELKRHARRLASRFPESQPFMQRLQQLATACHSRAALRLIEHHQDEDAPWGLASPTREQTTLLVIDDTPANLQLLLDQLEGQGYRVLVAEDGEEGRRRAELTAPDLILLDVVMPGVDGFETCRRLKAHPATQDIPVVFMTALADECHKVTGFEVGGIDYVTKPLQIAEVLARLKTHLALRSAEIELEANCRKLEQEIAERQRAESQLQFMATHDTLTGLPNRALLMDRLRHAIHGTHRHHQGLVVAFLDLDRFKEVNDTMGHEAGDQLLRTVAERIASCLREVDTAARVGGDEFVLVLDEVTTPHEALHVLARVLHAVSQPVFLRAGEVSVACSIGWSLYPDGGDNADTLLSHADTAMYRAKAAGHNRIQAYHDAG